jgi:hypothetical protein
MPELAAPGLAAPGQAAPGQAAPGLQRYACIGAAGFGIATIVLGVVMLFVFPSHAELAEGFRTPIIAFEFAKSDADLAFLSGESARTHREQMDAGHRWDMVFPFAYAGFVALLLVQIIARGQLWLWLAVPAALVIIPFDLRENGILLAITAALADAQPIKSLLQELYVATWLKWGALGISLAALAIGYLTQQAWLSALVALLAAGSIAACRISESAGVMAEAMSAAISVFFFYFAITSGVQAWKLLAGRIDDAVLVHQ